MARETQELEAEGAAGTGELAPGAVSPEQIKHAYAAILDGVPLPVSVDPEVVSRAIVERIMHAETFEEVFRPQELPAWREEYLNVPVKVEGFHLNSSTLSGSAVYAVVDLITPDGELVTVTCGGRNVLVQLVKALEKGWLTRPVRMVERPTSSGNKTLWLVDASLA